MRVLLISPLRGLDPPCGDITYTEELIANIGDDVDYTTYAEALADGSLIEITRANWHIAPIIAIVNKAINIFRGLRLLYWEPVRFFMLKPGVYDLIHVHLFPFKMLHCDAPIVYSAGSPISDLYRHTRKYSVVRESILRFIERRLCQCLNYNHSLFNHKQVDHMVVYTDYYKSILRSQSLNVPNEVSVLPISLADRQRARPINSNVVFGFIAFDFYAKGGFELISAFRKVSIIDSTARLIVVGEAPAEYATEPNVIFNGNRDRRYIVEEFLPSVDVFVYPTHQDCFSYVMLEALRAGCAICTSDYISMPEAVDYGNAGLISPVGDVESLATNMTAMLDTDTRHKYQAAARSQFLKKFDSAVVLSKLSEIYGELIASAPRSNLKTE